MFHYYGYRGYCNIMVPFKGVLGGISILWFPSRGSRGDFHIMFPFKGL